MTSAFQQDLAPVGIRLPAYASGSVAIPGGGRELLNYAAQVEETGFDSLWVIDHLLVAPALYATSWFDPLDILSAVGARTSSIQLGTAILVVPLWQPVLLAHRIATISHLLGGRLTLGIGPGWADSEFRAVDVPKRERGARTDESVELMKRLWTGEPVTFHGRFYSAQDVQIGPSLEQRPQVWVAGGSLTRARGTGDAPRMAATVLNRIVNHEGWIARSGGSDFTDVQRDWETIVSACEDESLDPPTFAHAQFVHIVDSANEADVLAQQLSAFKQVMGGNRSVEDLRASYLIGTIGQIRQRIADLREIGMEYLILNPVLPDPRQLDLISRYLIEVMM